MELCGFDSEVQAQIYKLASAGLCSNLDGQVMVDLMVKGPSPGDASYEEFEAQSSAIFNSLKRKSQFLYDALNSIEGIECQPLQVDEPSQPPPPSPLPPSQGDAIRASQVRRTHPPFALAAHAKPHWRSLQSFKLGWAQPP